MLQQVGCDDFVTPIHLLTPVVLIPVTAVPSPLLLSTLEFAEQVLSAPSQV